MRKKRKIETILVPKEYADGHPQYKTIENILKANREKIKEIDYKQFVLEHFEPIPQPGLVYKAKIHTIIDINGKKYRISAEDPPTLQYMYGESKS